jgi:hypothetical protein
MLMRWKGGGRNANEMDRQWKRDIKEIVMRIPHQFGFSTRINERYPSTQKAMILTQHGIRDGNEMVMRWQTR